MNYTHEGRFYGIPVYLDLEDQEGLIMEGKNIVFNLLIPVATFLHNYAREPFAQVFAAVFNQPYEPGFPVWVGKRLDI